MEIAINHAALRYWLDVASVLGILWGCACSVWWILDRRNRVTQSAMNEMRAQHTAAVNKLAEDIALRRRVIDEDIRTLRETVGQAPTRADLERVCDAISQLSETAHKLCGTVHALDGAVTMINQHLLQR